MADLSLKKTLEQKASMSTLRRKVRWGETITQGLLFFSGFFSIFTTLGIVYELGKEALLFFQMHQYSQMHQQCGAIHRIVRQRTRIDYQDPYLPMHLL